MPALKNYNADLKVKYNVTIKISLIFSLLFILGAFEFSPKKLKDNSVKLSTPEIINVENITQTKQEFPPDLPKPILPVISLSDDIEDIIMEDVSIDYKKEYTKLPDLVKDRVVVDEKIIFKVVEEPPQPIGGMKAIQEKLFYPEIPKRVGIEGKVIVIAVINEEGTVIKTNIYKSVFPELDDIAVKAVSETKFYPGKQRGKPVKVEVKIPIDFKLK